MVIDILNRLQKENKLSVLIQTGFLPCSIKRDMLIYEKFNEYLKDATLKKMDCYEMTAIDFKCSSGLIRKVIKRFS